MDGESGDAVDAVLRTRYSRSVKGCWYGSQTIQKFGRIAYVTILPVLQRLSVAYEITSVLDRCRLPAELLPCAYRTSFLTKYK